MQKSIFLTIVLVMCFSTLFSQNLDSYKYILVPNRYDFQKSQDQYQVNSLVKFLFNRAGYKAFMVGEELPQDLNNNNCLAAKAYVDIQPSMLSVKTVVRLEDCFGKTIMVTKVSRSKEKAYQKAYHESIRRTFTEIEALAYNYKPRKKEGGLIEKFDEQIVIKEEISESQKETNTIDKKVAKIEKRNKTQKEIKKSKKLGEPAEKIEMIKIKPAIINLLGHYEVEGWGKSEIVKKGNDFVFKGGDENIEFATIYKTSKPNIYIIKWLAFKQPQLLQIDNNKTLQVDSKKGTKYYKQIN